MPPFDPLAKQKRFRSMIAASTTAIHWDAFEKIIADPHKLAQLQQAFLDIANQPAPAPAPATASAFAPAANSAFAAPNSAFAPAATSAFAPAATSAFAPAAAPPPAAPTQAYPMDAQGHFYLRDSNISSQYFIGPHDFMEVTRTHDAPSCINLTDMLVHKSTKLYNQFAVGGKRNPWPRNTLVRLHDVDGEVRIDKTIVRYGESSKIKALPSNITWEQVKVWLALFDCQYVNDNATTTSSVATAWDFNAGSNATTFIVPAEVFPTRIRATAHGFCAAMGKLGSIVSSLGFSVLANDKRFGHTGIFWIFFGVSLLGLLVTLLLVPETKAYDADAVDRIELLERSRTA
ncbi:uncharacterized protein PSANT_00036 [Moesziomyces antarcticus]|uniref:Major facilitator superfamily (MFS) profile domain-containing protein n=1 Tax=Pseudozyma antarctica TaxID=84753 RepID=A0A5C3FD38_PSEA2|nr:uncharacterized protein PSANT_00036 [Moesziomyces antarcticus]